MMAYHRKDFIEYVDPSDLESYAEGDGDSSNYPDQGRRTSKLEVYERLRPYLRFIPPVEASIITYLYKHGITEREAGKLLDLAQVSVSERKIRSIRRIRFLELRGQLDRDFFYRTLKCVLRERQLEALWVYLNTASYTRAGQVLGLGGVDARKRIISYAKRLAKSESQPFRYWSQIIELTRQHPLILDSPCFVTKPNAPKSKAKRQNPLPAVLSQRYR